ncbi:MAG: glycosyltransferase family 2 protein [Lachnospiraceae bacterium]|nr:glycosyltransferase family 2 protein [Lachnospiraceae bacterium]
MTGLIRSFNFFVLVVLSLSYFYQMIYVFIRWFLKPENVQEATPRRYAVAISARNESAVIGELLESIRKQNYPSELLDVYVVADNCTDNTAQVARKHRAVVFERFDRVQVGKGYALNYLFSQIETMMGIEAYDGYLVFDADNVLDENYIKEMNKVFAKGYSVVTSYRNSKNYGSNWISAGYALWFLRESKYLNGARMQCGTSCAISGTGFLVSSGMIRANHGWKHHLLTEDIEFSVDNTIQGEIIGYCEKAVLYDEQPVNFRDSWYQRLRWTKGFYQVFRKYGGELFRGAVKRHSFQCYDMLMTVAPATLLTLFTLFGNSIFAIAGLLCGRPEWTEITLKAVGGNFLGIYLSLFFFGFVTTISEWRQIHCETRKKLLYMFTFPVFIFTYIPIAVAALFKRVTWIPIHHNIVKSVGQIRG